MMLHSYVVARDYGFAPNPFFGICTLATCKPNIRKVGRIDDWVLGTGSKKRKRGKHVVYAMRVTGTLTFDEYWADPSFQVKKPNLRGSKKQAFGDNIYHREPETHRWHQENSHHSFEDGGINAANVRNDTQVDRVLISDDFVYWGGSGPELPARFLSYGPHAINICAVRNHKNDFPADLVQEFVAWIRSMNEQGCPGEPLDWVRTP